MVFSDISEAMQANVRVKKITEASIASLLSGFNCAQSSASNISCNYILLLYHIFWNVINPFLLQNFTKDFNFNKYQREVGFLLRLVWSRWRSCV
jgi:hypothetical protein